MGRNSKQVDKNSLTNTKFFELISTLSPHEYHRFGKYLSSEYAGSNKPVMRLYNYFNRKKLNSPQLGNRAVLYEFVFGAEKFNEIKLNALLSNFVKLLEKFMITEQMQSEGSLRNKILLKIFQQRKAYKNHTQLLNKLKKTRTKGSIKNEEYYYENANIEFEIIQSKFEKIVFLETPVYQTMLDNIDMFYIAMKLKMHINALNHAREINPGITYKILFSNEINNYVEQNLAHFKKSHPVIYCNYLIIKTILEKTDNEKYYHELKQYLRHNEKSFDFQTLEYIYNELKIYCIYKIGSDDSSPFIKELFKLYQIFDKKFLPAKKDIYHSDFAGTIIISLNLNKNSYAETFFNKYKNKLTSEGAEDTFNLSKASILFARAKYNKSLDYLSKVRYNNFNYYLRIKVLLIKIYYETGNIESIYYEIDSLKHYILRNRQRLGRYSTSVNNFIKYMNILLKARGGNSVNTDKIIEKITAEKNVFNMKWLIAKFSKL